MRLSRSRTWLDPFSSTLKIHDKVSGSVDVRKVGKTHYCGRWWYEPTSI